MLYECSTHYRFTLQVIQRRTNSNSGSLSLEGARVVMKQRLSARVLDGATARNPNSE